MDLFAILTAGDAAADLLPVLGVGLALVAITLAVFWPRT